MTKFLKGKILYTGPEIAQYDCGLLHAKLALTTSVILLAQYYVITNKTLMNMD